MDDAGSVVLGLSYDRNKLAGLEQSRQAIEGVAESLFDELLKSDTKSYDVLKEKFPGTSGERLDQIAARMDAILSTYKTQDNMSDAARKIIAQEFAHTFVNHRDNEGIEGIVNQ
jgi:hypothetical protein